MSAVTSDSAAPAARRGAGWLWALALAPLVAFQLWLIFTHAPGRDELQAFMIARDSDGLPGLLANLRYEGHPALWYLVLAAAMAVLRAPVVLALVQAMIALAVTAIVWLRAPFARWLTLLILAGYFIVFEYGVIARNYSLGCLLLFAWLALRRTRWGWLMLALMANTAVHFALLSAFCLVAGAWIERRWSWRGAGVWALGCLVAAAVMAPALDVQTVTGWLVPSAAGAVEALQRMAPVLAPAAIGRAFHWQSVATSLAGAVVGGCAGVLAAAATARAPRASVLMLGLFGALAAMSLLLYPVSARHVGVVVLFAVALEWMRLERPGEEGREKAASPLFAVWMAANAACGLWAAGCALWTPFSPGPALTEWIAQHHLQSAAWAAYPGYFGGDVSAYFERQTFNLQKQCEDTFVRWDRHAFDVFTDEALRARLSRPGPFAYLISDDEPAAVHAPVRLLARFDKGLGGEDLYVYAMQRPAAGAVAACR